MCNAVHDDYGWDAAPLVDGLLEAACAVQDMTFYGLTCGPTGGHWLSPPKPADVLLDSPVRRCPNVIANEINAGGSPFLFSLLLIDCDSNGLYACL
jgi:hypothetical protein